MDLEDIASIAKIQLVNYIGLFALDENKDLERYEEFVIKFQRKNKGKNPSKYELLSKNKADYTLFMRQRMADLIRICQQKAKNIKGARVDEYMPFCGKVKPPEDIRDLLVDHEKYGFRKIDNVAYKAVRKRAKSKKTEVFEHEGTWYVAVPLAHRNLTLLDFAGAGFDPLESIFNQTPEQLLNMREQEKRFDKKRKRYKNYSKEDKVRVIRLFLDKNEQNPLYKEEVETAKKTLIRLGVENGR
jgi:hypothetical protein